MQHCDLETGVCGVADGPDKETFNATAPTEKVTILYATDPICSHCWAMEPVWRKLLYHYGDHINYRYVYGGLLPGWGGFADAGAGIARPADVAPHWDEVARHYGQPIDSSVWLTDPLASSYPPSVAAHAVRLLAPDREAAFLRRLRHALFLEARNIARPEVLAACAADVGVDTALFSALLDSGAAAARFQADLTEMQQLQVRGFPSLIIEPPAGQGLVLRGSQSYTRLEQALLDATGLPQQRTVPDAATALQAYGSGTTLEFAALLERDLTDTQTALRDAGAVARPLADDFLWEVAD